MSQPLPIRDLFDTERVPTYWTVFLLVCYFPIGATLLVARLIIGFQTFLLACMLRKSTKIRNVVLRAMCFVLGLWVVDHGKRAPNAKMMCANHVSALDHLAIDIIDACILPSVWDIPNVLRWVKFRVLGYADLGARQGGRAELIRRAKEHIKTEELPLLAFPEGAITNGRKALLKFSTWPMEVSDQIQPIGINLWRPFNVRCALLGSSWYTDVLWFFYLPFTYVSVEFLPVVTRNDEEPVEDFAVRVSKVIADTVWVSTSNITNQDAVEAAKRHAKGTFAPPKPAKKISVDTRRLDELAMKIKQAHPTIPIYAIRQDLEKTLDPRETIQRIISSQLTANSYKMCGKVTPNTGDWKRLYDVRKWDMIEKNRALYMEKVYAEVAAMKASAGDA